MKIVIKTKEISPKNPPVVVGPVVGFLKLGMSNQLIVQRLKLRK